MIIPEKSMVYERGVVTLVGESWRKLTDAQLQKMADEKGVPVVCGNRKFIPKTLRATAQAQPVPRWVHPGGMLKR